MAGLEVLFASAAPAITRAQDALVCFLHWGGGHARLLRLGCRRPGTPWSQGGMGPEAGGVFCPESGGTEVRSRVPDLPLLAVGPGPEACDTFGIPVVCGPGGGSLLHL